MSESLRASMARLFTEAAAAAEANHLDDAAYTASAAFEAWNEAGQPSYEAEPGEGEVWGAPA